MQKKNNKIPNTRCLTEAIIYSINSPLPRVTSKIFILERIREGDFYYLLFCSFEIYKNQARFFNSSEQFSLWDSYGRMNNECLIVKNSRLICRKCILICNCFGFWLPRIAKQFLGLNIIYFSIVIVQFELMNFIEYVM